MFCFTNRNFSPWTQHFILHKVNTGFSSDFRIRCVDVRLSRKSCLQGNNCELSKLCSCMNCIHHIKSLTVIQCASCALILIRLSVISDGQCSVCGLWFGLLALSSSALRQINARNLSLEYFTPNSALFASCKIVLNYWWVIIYSMVFPKSASNWKSMLNPDAFLLNPRALDISNKQCNWHHKC